MNHRASQGMFLMGLAALVWAFGTLSCGGGGGGGAAAGPNQQLATEAVVHESAVSGPHLIPTSGSGQFVNIRTATFSPSKADDLLMYVAAEITWDNVLPLYIEVRDQNNQLLAANTLTPGIADTARLIATLPSLAVLQYLGSMYPATNYTVELFCQANAQVDVSITNLKFSFATLEGARKVVVSSLVVG